MLALQRSARHSDTGTRPLWFTFTLTSVSFLASAAPFGQRMSSGWRGGLGRERSEDELEVSFRDVGSFRGLW